MGAVVARERQRGEDGEADEGEESQRSERRVEKYLERWRTEECRWTFTSEEEEEESKGMRVRMTSAADGSSKVGNDEMGEDEEEAVKVVAATAVERDRFRGGCDIWGGE